MDYAKLTETDIDPLLKILGDPEVMQFSLRGAEDLNGIKDFVSTTVKRYERDGLALWAVIQKESREFVGICGISLLEIDNKKEFEIGYRFAKAHWGKGFATEAAKGCFQFGSKEKNIKRFISIIEKENLGSINVAEKVGMKAEKDSTFHDIPVVIYSIEI